MCHNNFRLTVTASRSSKIWFQKTCVHLPSWVMWTPMWGQQLEYIAHIRRHKNVKVKVTSSWSKVTVSKVNIPIQTDPSREIKGHIQTESGDWGSNRLDTAGATRIQGQILEHMVPKTCQCTPTPHGQCAHQIW